MITEVNTPITFDPETNTYRLYHDWRGDEPVSTAIVTAVATVTDASATDLNPLFEAVDPDALDQLYAPSNGGDSRDDGWVSFRFNDCVVTVYASGTIEIVPVEDGGPITAPVPRMLRDR